MLVKHSTASTALLPFLFHLTSAQQSLPNVLPDTHPRLITQFCTLKGGCVPRNTALVVDATLHPFVKTADPAQPCDAPLDGCSIAPVNNYSALNVFTQLDGSSLMLKAYSLNQTGPGLVSPQPRVYLLAEGEIEYEMFSLLGKEFTFEVDVSKLGCGMNGALYLVEMEKEGGKKGDQANNVAGAVYGTGYCDAQCFNTTFANGLVSYARPNFCCHGWTSLTTNQRNTQNQGICCAEMDIWEANSLSTQLAPHPCTKPGVSLCSNPIECGKGEGGFCDKAGCNLNSFFSDPNYYGPDNATFKHGVDTRRPFTVVTQFATLRFDDTVLGEIRRLYVQDGRLITSSITTVNKIDEPTCEARGVSVFTRDGGLPGMGGALGRGMVLAMSLWNSKGDFMNWLDADGAGPCGLQDGNPALLEQDVAAALDVSVTFANIRFGEIGSTFSGTGAQVER